jgi:hypothetical protein
MRQRARIVGREVVKDSVEPKMERDLNSDNRLMTAKLRGID